MKKLLLVTTAVMLSMGLYACGQSASQSQAQAVSEAASMASEAMESASEAASEMMESMSEVASEAASEMKDAASTVGADVSSEIAQMVDESVFTLDELAEYNGKDGAKAYIAVDGVVYDVSDSKAWKDGMHNGFEAGKDLSEEMRNAPHGLSKLDNLKKVGILAE